MQMWNACRRQILCAALLVGTLPCMAADAAPAIVFDGAVGVGSGGGDFFYVAAINGVEVQETSYSRRRRAGIGRGSYWVLQFPSRSVPAGAVRLKLAGQREYAVPIENLFRTAASWSVEGDVEVTLEAGVSYRVNGAIDGFRREVRLEREDNQQVLARVQGSAMDDPKVKAEMAGAGYTCCNLHYEDDWISDANWPMLPFVPAGARILVKDYGSNRAEVLIDGRKMRIGHDYGRKQESREAYIAKLIVREDPALRLVTYEPEVQAAIRAGKLLKGMTRDQVLMSMGHPRTDTAPSPAARRWIYWLTEQDSFAVVWSEQDKVEFIDAPDNVLDLVLYGR